MHHSDGRCVNFHFMLDTGSELFVLCEPGHAIAPLFDVPRWRFEALVRAPVRRPELYRMALTCPSALSAGRRVDESYERLEFLGDAVLSTVIRQKLLRTFPDQDEVRVGCAAGHWKAHIHDPASSQRDRITSKHLFV